MGVTFTPEQLAIKGIDPDGNYIKEKVKKKESKYKAIPAFVNGIRFDSRKEARYYGNLLMLKARSGPDRLEKIDRQVRFPLAVNGEHITTYVIDFIEHYADGRVIHTDVKGYKKGAAYNIFKIKKKLMKAIYGIDVQEI